MNLCLIHVRSGQIVHRQFALGGTERARQASPLARKGTHAPWRGEFVRSVTPAVSGLSTTRSDSPQGSAANCRWWRALRRLRSHACENTRPASRLNGGEFDAGGTSMELRTAGGDETQGEPARPVRAQRPARRTPAALVFATYGQPRTTQTMTDSAELEGGQSVAARDDAAAGHLDAGHLVITHARTHTHTHSPPPLRSSYCLPHPGPGPGVGSTRAHTMRDLGARAVQPFRGSHVDLRRFHACGRDGQRVVVGR